MKTYQFNRLFAVATIASLSVACGTSSPTGPDLMSDATSSALRAGPVVPPPAPSPLPEPQPSPRAEPTPDTTLAPLPSGDLRPPVGTPPDDAGVDTVPNPSPNPDGPSGDTIPSPSPEPSPNPGPGGPAGGTPPAPAGEPLGGSCFASTVEIRRLATSAIAEGMAFEATLRATDGTEITDSSCETMVWTVATDHNSARVFINYGPNSRFVTITGMSPGTYTIGATTPNDQSGSLVLVVDAP